MALLELNDVHAYYGNIHALKGISLTVDKGEIVTLIGGNGAGKSTTLRTICGLMRQRTGSITLDGKDLTPYKAHELVSQGIAMVPEGRGVFAKLTVTENLEMGAYHRSDKQGIAADMQQVFEIFPRLSERRKQVAGTMSGGEQQMLAIGRALMSKPSLLLLDEPSMGPAAGGHHLRDCAADQPRGHHDSARRAKRPYGAGRGAARLCAPDRRDRVG